MVLDTAVRIRGIGGETTDQFAERLEPSIGNAASAVVLAGISGPTVGVFPGDGARIIHIVRVLQRLALDASNYVVSTIPRTPGS